MRSISFTDSPTGPERAEKRPRLCISCDNDNDMRDMLPATSSSSSSSFASPDHLFQGGLLIIPAAAAAAPPSSSPQGANGCGLANSSGCYMVTCSEVGVIVAASSSGHQQTNNTASNEATGSTPVTLSSSLSSSSAPAEIISGSSSYLIPLSIEVEDEVEGGPDNLEAGPSGQQQQHDSPSGSEVSEAGPSSGQYRDSRQQQHSVGQQVAAAQHRRRSSCSLGSPTGGLSEHV